MRSATQAATVAVWFPLGLLIDAKFGWWGLTVTTIGTIALLAWVVRTASRLERIRLCACVFWATLGEFFLTEGAGLYEYRLGIVPPYVPFGHALLFWLGVTITDSLGETVRSLLRSLAALLTITCFLWLGDQQSLWLLLVFALMTRFGRSSAVYGSMFLLALILELVGTRIGTWRWAAVEPTFGLATTNPPVAAGVLYCVLDGIVLLSHRLVPRRKLS
ncbi:MAG: hypothetical protein AB7I19_03510 [Planctomycetota bacterium]